MTDYLQSKEQMDRTKYIQLGHTGGKTYGILRELLTCQKCNNVVPFHVLQAAKRQFRNERFGKWNWGCPCGHRNKAIVASFRRHNTVETILRDSMLELIHARISRSIERERNNLVMTLKVIKRTIIATIRQVAGGLSDEDVEKMAAEFEEEIAKDVLEWLMNHEATI